MIIMIIIKIIIIKIILIIIYDNNNTNLYTGIDISTCSAVINVCPVQIKWKKEKGKKNSKNLTYYKQALKKLTF